MRGKFLQKDNGRHALAFFIYTFLVLALIFATGTVYSGFHLSDDQILVGFSNQLNHSTFLATARDAIQEDLYLRFRPMAIFYYVAFAKWLYPDFFRIAIAVAIQGIFTCYFFYRFARQLKCLWIVSFLFPLFILCGNQGVIFWRNCVNETFGILLLSLSLFFLGKLIYTQKRHTINLFFFSFFLLLATFTKESFIILVPAILFFKIWQEAEQRDVSFVASLKNNLGLVIFFALVVIAEIGIIYYYKSISDHFIEYVSVDQESFSGANLFISLYRLIITKGYAVIILPAMVFIFWRSTSGNRKGVFKNFLLPLLMLYGLIVLPQALLYAKSLIFERYLLPGTLGSALLILLLSNFLEENARRFAILKMAFLPACSLLLAVQLFLMVRAAPEYAAAGFEANHLLETVASRTKASDIIVLAATPEGQSDKALSVKAYLTAPIGGNKQHVFIDPVTDSTQPANYVIKSFEKDTRGSRYADIGEKNKVACFVFFINTKAWFLHRYPDIDTTQYEGVVSGSFYCLFKK